MKKTLLAASIAALAFSPVAMAQNYQMEGGAHYNYADYDAGGDSDNFGLNFTYHINEVSTAGHPLQEAGFLERSTNIGAGYDSWSGNKFRKKGDFFNLNGEAYIEDFYVAADVSINSPDQGSDTTDFGVKVGFLPMDGLLFTLGYDLLEKQGDIKSNGKRKDLDIISLGGKFVTPLDGEMALNLEAEVSFADNDDDTVLYELGGDVYFNRTLSAGLLIRDTDASGTKTEVGIRGNYFITPLVSVNAQFAHNYDYVKKDILFGIGANMRF